MKFRFCFIILFILFFVSCHSTKNTTINADLQFEEIELQKNLSIDWSNYTTEGQEVLCHFNGIHYSSKRNAIFLIHSDKEMMQKNKYFVLNLDKSKSTVSKIQDIEIKSQNNQSFFNIYEFQRLIDKGKRPKYNIPFYSDIAYDEGNNAILIINSGTNWSYKNVDYFNIPSIHSLSDDNRLLGQFSLAKMFKPSTYEEMDDIQMGILTISPTNEKVFTMTRKPLKMDENSSDSKDIDIIRLCSFRAASKSEESQYLYPLRIPYDKKDEETEKQIVNLIAMNDTILWVLEEFRHPNNSIEYQVYEVALSKPFQLTSRKPVNELKKKPVLQKHFLFNLNEFLPNNNVKIIDFCWGPTINKKQTLYFLANSGCSSEENVEIFQVLLK